MNLWNILFFFELAKVSYFLLFDNKRSIVFSLPRAFFCLETKETKIQGLQIKILKTTSTLIARAKSLALQAHLQARSLALSRCFLRFLFEAGLSGKITFNFIVTFIVSQRVLIV
jgi:hypothetical protein